MNLRSSTGTGLSGRGGEDRSPRSLLAPGRLDRAEQLVLLLDELDLGALAFLELELHRAVHRMVRVGVLVQALARLVLGVEVLDDAEALGLRRLLGAFLAPHEFRARDAVPQALV